MLRIVKSHYEFSHLIISHVHSESLQGHECELV